MTLETVFGSRHVVDQLLQRVQAETDPVNREQSIVQYYCNQLKSAVPLNFVAPFRVESANRASTSHYLLHATKNSTAFRIMKDVMSEHGRDDGAAVGQLGLYQTTDASDGLFLRGDLAEQEKEIVELLRTRSGMYVQEVVALAERPTDMLSGKSYRECLKRLERNGRIQVFRDDKVTSAPHTVRRKPLGKTTLADHLWVKLAT
jgi:hypothetical protein